MEWVRDTVGYNDETPVWLRLRYVESVEVACDGPILQIGLYFRGDQRRRIYSADKARSILISLGLMKEVVEEIGKRISKRTG